MTSTSPVWTPALTCRPKSCTWAGDFLATPDGPRRPVEGREEPVAISADLSPSVAYKRFAHDAMVPRQQVPPLAITERGGALRRAGDVGKQHRGQHPVGGDMVTHAGQELLDVVERIRVPISDAP